MNPLEGHISRAFDGALGALHLHVVAMGSLAIDQVRTATRAYLDGDLAAAATVIERERAINAYDDALDAEQLTLLARLQPVASDLKFVIAFSRAVGELERVGDESKKIARIVADVGLGRDAESVADVGAMGARAASLLRAALTAFDALDAQAAASVIAGDKELDQLYERALARLVARGGGDAAQFRRFLHAAFVMKALERIGDHARNLARLLQFNPAILSR